MNDQSLIINGWWAQALLAVVSAAMLAVVANLWYLNSEIIKLNEFRQRTEAADSRSRAEAHAAEAAMRDVLLRIEQRLTRIENKLDGNP